MPPSPRPHPLTILGCLLCAASPAALADETAAVAEEMASEDEPALTVHEPMYFVAGGRGGVKARFQLSLKYRLFDEDSAPVRLAGWTRGLHFAYTQTSLWSWAEESSPFDDSSYRPSLFWQYGQRTGAQRTGFVLAGIEHESNGQAGEQSRGIDIAFVQPGVATTLLGRELVLAPRLYAYLRKDDGNRDIHRYRGFGDFVVRYGNDDSWVLQATYRQGTGGHRSTQLDLSIPIRERIFARTGAYLYVQLFEGYGESLLDYNRRVGTGARIGLAIVR